MAVDPNGLMVSKMTTSDDGLWIHQESAVISAEFHDVWRFSPDFLLEEEIVPGSWVCHRASRSNDQVSIQYGPSHWSMTQNELWISVYPDQALTSEFDAIPEDGEMSMIQVLAHKLLADNTFPPFSKTLVLLVHFGHNPR